MKFNSLSTRVVGIVFFCLMALPMAAPGMDEGSEKVPVAAVQEFKYRFPAVVDGTEVLHDFIVKNKGDAPLDIQKIRTG